MDNPPSGDGSHRRYQYSTSRRFERPDFLIFDRPESLEFAISIGEDSLFSTQQLVSRRRTGDGAQREGILEGFSLVSYWLLVDPAVPFLLLAAQRTSHSPNESDGYLNSLACLSKNSRVESGQGAGNELGKPAARRLATIRAAA